jgi:hypothetical protein
MMLVNLFSVERKATGHSMFNRLLSRSSKIVVSVFVVMLLVGTLVPMASVSAQGEAFGLSQTDFLLLTTANTLTRFAASYAYEFELDVTVSGITDVNGTVDISGNGEIVFGASPTLRLDVQGDVALEGDENIPLAVQTLIVDGVVYINMDNAGWGGVTLEEAATAFVEGMVEGGTMPVGSPTDMASLMQMGELFGLGQAGQLLAAVPPEDYLTITRSADQTVEDQTVAVFVIDVDLPQMLSNDSLIS